MQAKLEADASLGIVFEGIVGRSIVIFPRVGVKPNDDILSLKPLYIHPLSIILQLGYRGSFEPFSGQGRCNG
jgi:hypothetical protein